MTNRTIFKVIITTNGTVTKTINYPTLAAVEHFVYKMDKDIETIAFNQYVETTGYAIYYNKNTNTTYTAIETEADKLTQLKAHLNILNKKDREAYINRTIANGEFTREQLEN